MIEDICLIAYKLESQKDKSFYGLLSETGYLTNSSDLDQKEIEKHLNSNSDLLTSWLRYSEDKRVNSGWYFIQSNGKSKVGFIKNGICTNEEVFESSAKACSYFILKEIYETKN